MTSWTYSASTESNLMKVKYGKLIDKQFAQNNVLMGRIKIKDNFVGSQIEEPVEQSIGGGVGCGSLPTANESKIGKATITSKKLYAAVSIDRESMKASKSSEGAFVKFTKYPVKMATRSFDRNFERMLVRNSATGDGNLATVASIADSDPIFVITYAANTNMAAFEEGDIVNFDSGDTDKFEITAVDETAATNNITVTRLTGSQVPAATDETYMQSSEGKEIFGLNGILAATSSTLYGVTVGRRWQAYQKDASSAALSTDLMNDCVINLKKQCGESPNLILTSYKQYVKLLNLLEDQKRYNLPARDKKFKGVISFAGVEYMSADGPIPVFPSRFMDDEKMFFLNDAKIVLHRRPGGFSWFDEDGTVFLRAASADSYEARYGGYCQVFVNPHFHAILDNLA